LSRTALSWLPLTLALPLVPIYAWLGTTGDVPPGLVVLIPAAVLAGAALIVGNGLVDVERDAPVGKATVAVRIGSRRAWAVHAAAFLVAVATALALAPDASNSPGLELLRIVRRAGIPIGAAVIAVGAALLADRRAGVRERGWELEAIGTAVVGLGWLAGAAGGAGGGPGP
jgi:4-hydroxybenzoate polyprenyltransferase